MKYPSRMGTVIENGREVPAVVSWHGRALGPRKKPHNDGRRYSRIMGKKSHTARAERALGRPLPPNAVVHHVDPTDKYTSSGLLVICQDQAYHALIERRGKALRECGNANWLRCYRCGKWDDPKNLIVNERPNCKGVRPRRVGHLDVVHEERGGVCVDLSEPRPINAGVCSLSPSGRHHIGAKYDRRKKRPPAGLDSKCVDCGQPIRRAHQKAVRWYAATTFGEREAKAE